MPKHQIKLAVCDDSSKEQELLVAMISKYMDLHEYIAEINIFSSGEELLEADITKYDLIILDIFMGEMNGISTAHEIMNRRNEAKIIFCSTSNEFAAESYDVNALRYLTKPVSEEKLFLTLDRFFSAYTQMQMLEYKSNHKDESMLLSDVIWIESDKHKCIIHTKNGDIITTTTISQFADQLRYVDFVKPIRYALVPLKMIAAVPSTTLTLRDGSEIPVSRELRAEIKNAYMDYKMKNLMKRG